MSLFFENGSGAGASPLRPVPSRWIAALALAQLGLWLGLYAPLKTLLPLLADQLSGSGMGGKEGLLAAATLLGVAYGVYIATHQALVLAHLPDPSHHARDLAVFNGANTAPMVLAPALSWLCVVHLGGYSTLFGVASLLIAASLLPLRALRR